MELDLNLDDPAPVDQRSTGPFAPVAADSRTALNEPVTASQRLRSPSADATVKRMRLPVIGGQPVSFQLQVLAVTFLILLAFAGYVAVMDGRTAVNRAMHLGIAGEIATLTERIARLGPLTVQGSTAAQLELETLRKREARLLAQLNSGGTIDGRFVPPVDPALRTAVDVVSARWLTFNAAVQPLLAPRPTITSTNATSMQAFDTTYVQLRDAVSGLQHDAMESVGQRTRSRALIAVLGSLATLVLVLAFRVYNSDASVRQARLARQRREAEEANAETQAAIRQLMDEMTSLADGDLTVRASINENLMATTADAMNYAIEELSVLVKRINDTAWRVAAAAGVAANTSEQLLAASDTQSQEIRRASGQVLSMVQSMNEVSGKAEKSAGVARESLDAATQGAAAVAKSISGMDGIRSQIQETSKRIKRLGESSQEIGEIVELISDITEQTNVLALNAAIQAATAGEAGRGFTIISEEVQRLAERSADATRRIASLVKTIQADTHDAVSAMEHSTQGVVEGARLSDDAGKALANISEVSRQLTELIESISTDTHLQAEVAARVAQAMSEILRITEHTSAGTRSTTISISELADLAVELKGSVAGFKV